MPVSNGNTPVSTGNTVAAGSTGNTGADYGSPPTVPPGVLLLNAALPTGTWGGGLLIDTSLPTAALTVSQSGSLVTLPCGEIISYSKPIVLDATGSFSVQGTLLSTNASTGSGPVMLTGQVAVSTANGINATTIFLGVNNPGAQSGNGTYDLELGRPAIPYVGACP